MTARRLYIIIFTSAVVLAALIMFSAGFSADTSSRARLKLAGEISSLEKKKEQAEADKVKIAEEIGSLETELSTKDTVNNYYMEYQKTNERLTAQLKSLESQSAALDAQIAEKQTEAEKQGKITGTSQGKSYSLNKNETYTCPDKIPAGRYIVSGRGTVVIYGTDGKTRATENLDVAFNNSYTFDLTNNEKIKVTENAVLTELK